MSAGDLPLASPTPSPPMPPMILALDTATTSGAAWGNVGTQPQWTAFTAKGASLGAKLWRFRAWLNSVIDETNPTLIVYESRYLPVGRQPRVVRAGTAVGVAPAGTPPINIDVLKLLLGIDGEVHEVAFGRVIELREATSAEFIAYFTGKARHGGRAAKKAATIAACDRMGWVTESDDVADALALWAFAEHKVAPEIAARRMAGAGVELGLRGTLDRPVQTRIGRREVDDD